MIRTIIKIDEALCNGCGLCVSACHEGAIGLVDNKAVLLRDDYCDGLGNCLPVCPTGAISFEEREAAAFDEEAVKANMEHARQGHGCPGSQAATFAPMQQGFGCPGSQARAITPSATPAQQPSVAAPCSQLGQWPVQIKLVPVNAPYFHNAHLLIAADCTAYAYGNFHAEFMANKVTLIGCPKLDDGDYSEKLTQIIKTNSLKSVTVVRMEVPCCGGIEHAVTTALRNSGKLIPWRIVTVTRDGKILENI